MKLYATTTSERASKGQGGKYLNIDILDEGKNLIAYISVLHQNKKPTIKMYYNLDIIDEPVVIGEYLSQAVIMSGQLKGKQKKDEKYTQDFYTCEQCGKQTHINMKTDMCAECSQ